MSDVPLRTDLGMHFRECDPLEMPALQAKLCDREDDLGARCLRIIETPLDVDETYEVYLEVHEAIALRDWLNRVLP